MKISSIGFSTIKNTKKPNINNKNRNVQATSDFSKKEISQSFVVTLASFKGESSLPKNFKKREKYLREEMGVDSENAKKIAAYEDKEYKKALQLIEEEIDETIIDVLVKLPDEKYEQAKKLMKMEVKDENLGDLSKLDDEDFKKAQKFLKEDYETNTVCLMVNLDDEQISRMKNIVDEGKPPYVAAKFASLTQEEMSFAQDLYSKGYSIDICCDIAQAEEEKRDIYVKNLKDGIDENSVIEIGNLDEEAQKRVPELSLLNIGDNNIADFAKLSEEDYKEVLKLMKEGTLAENAYDFLVLKKEGKIKPTLQEMLDRGYGLNAAFSIELMTEGELDILNKLLEKFPEMEEFFKQNYDLEFSVMQHEDKAEVLLTKQIKIPGQNKITFYKLFDSDGNEKNSRLEENSDYSTSSMMKNGNNLFRLTYLRGGDVNEMTQLIQDEETKAVTGVYYSKASEVLKGCFETTYYDINDFKTSSKGYYNHKQKAPKCVNGEGTTISKVEKLDDGRIHFTESFVRNNLLTEREYFEGNDEQGNLTEKSYKYQISDENGNVIMDVQRLWKKNEDETTTNIINGHEYKMTFDDKKYTIKIESEGIEKTLNFSKKLAKCSKDNLWNVAKKLDVDTLLTIYNDVKKWHHCVDEESVADGYIRHLSTGNDIQIIAHETGHLKSYENEDKILENEDIIEIYSKEFDIFEAEVPYNEKEFVEYFSKRSDLCESNGLNEFVAETNMLLSTYGHKMNKLKTRGQFLVRFFPETISVIAKELGKTSTKNLLCEE